MERRAKWRMRDEDKMDNIMGFDIIKEDKAHSQTSLKHGEETFVLAGLQNNA